jgi:alpha-beta hydrolase superfamily lysophospholipase
MQAMYGDADTRTDVEAAKELFEDSVCTDKQFQLYPGARHQLLHDKPDVSQNVMQDSLDWMVQRLE